MLQSKIDKQKLALTQAPPFQSLPRAQTLQPIASALSPPAKIEIQSIKHAGLKLNFSNENLCKQSRQNEFEADSVFSSHLSMLRNCKMESVNVNSLFGNLNSVTKPYGRDLCDPFNYPALSVVQKMMDQDSNCPEFNLFELEVASEDLAYLDPLYTCLVCIFEGQPVDICLPKLDFGYKEVIWAILGVKLLRRVSRLKKKDLELPADLGDIPELLSKSSEKRLEECFKFIMTKLFKRLKKRFAKERQTRGNLEDEFYEQYFGELSRSTGQSLADFHYPQYNKSGQQAFRITYFKNLFKSQKFRQEFHNWVDNFAWKDYKQSIEKKLHHVVCAWDKLIKHKPESKQEILSEMAESFRKCNTQKLPWTKYEMVWALDRIKKSID